MPIGSITQSVSVIPAAGKRGVDVQTVFVTKQEDFQDHLVGTTVDELNTLKDQLNSRIGEINSTATTMNGYADTASAGASTATTKVGEASTSASEALTSRNQAETFKNNASASATKASQWADEAYNVEVEIGRYSAKHWSTVAKNFSGDAVKLTGNQTVDDVKTFTSSPIVPAPTTDFQVATKGYVDSKADYSALTAKTTPVDADLIAIADSTSSFSLKKLTWANLKVTLFSSSVLTGTPTAPTATVGTDTTQIATTAFVIANAPAVVSASETTAGVIELATTAEAQSGTDAVRAITPLQLFNSLKGSNQSLASNGYQKLHGGLIIQWGNSSSGVGTATFPIAFPNRCFNIQVSFYENSGSGNFASGYISANSITKNGFSYGYVGVTARQWLAVGY